MDWQCDARYAWLEGFYQHPTGARSEVTCYSFLSIFYSLCDLNLEKVSWNFF